MSVAFVPFFEKVPGSESLPEYQFSQYKISKVKLSQSQPSAFAPAPIPEPIQEIAPDSPELNPELSPELALPSEPQNPTPQLQVSHVHVGVSREELKTKALSDLKNALKLSLPDEAIQQIVSDLSQFRSPERFGDAMDSGEPGAEGMSNGDKPSIRLERDGDKVTHIIVECECGRALTLDCIY